MKKSTYISTGVFGILILLLCAAVVSADPSVIQTPETQGLVTSTSVNALGLVTQTDNLAWQISNLGISSKLSAPGYLPLDDSGQYTFIWDDVLPYMSGSPGQVQYTTAYDANIVAQAGQTSFIKNMNINTGNKAIGQSNVNAQTGLTFVAMEDGGNVAGSENLLIDGAGMYDLTSTRMLCPFASQNSLFIPPYCNIVLTGSTYDLTVGSVTTNANNRFVGSDATAPVVQNYNIDVKPYGTSEGRTPAMGSAMAYMKVHTQEGKLILRDDFLPENDEVSIYQMVKSQDLTYSESSSTLGIISAFTKSLSYNSGMSLL